MTLRQQDRHSNLARGEWHDRARALHAEHPDWSHRRIADEIGVGRSAVTKILNPAAAEWNRASNARRNKAKQEWGRENSRVTCPKCGEPMAINSKYHDWEQCSQCRSVAAEMRQLEMVRLRNEEGLSNREIAARLGTTPVSVATELTRVRASGYAVARDPYMERRREVLRDAA